MGKLLITNNKDWYEKLTNCFKTAFTQSYFYEKDEIYLAVYNKLNMLSDNHFEEGDDFCVSAGTLIYKEEMGRTALEGLFNDSKEEEIKKLRANTLGSYAVAIKKGSSIDIYLDETHTYYIYYYYDGANFIITNTFWHIGYVTKTEINETGLLEKGVRNCIMSNQTPLRDIYKLCAGEVAHIDLSRQEFTIKNIELNDYHCRFATAEEAVDAIVSEVKSVSSVRSKYLDKCLHFLTGGIDSRLEAAIHLYNNDSLVFGYWKGKDLITNGTDADISIVKSIAENKGKEFKLYDVSEDYDEALAGLSEQRCTVLGEYSSVYSGNSKVLSVFKNAREFNWVGFGYLGELLRPLTELDRKYHAHYSIESFIRDVYCRTGLENLFKVSDFYDYIGQELLKFTNGKKELSKEEAFRLFSFSRYDADCYMNNYSNMFLYSFPIFGQKRIADMIDSLQYVWMDGDYISISLIKRLQPELLSFPIYSHHRAFIYNENTSKMEETVKFRFLDSMKQIFKNTPVYKIIYLKWLHKYIRPQSLLNEKIAEVCANELLRNKTLKKSTFDVNFDGKWTGIDITTLAGFVAELKVLDVLE